MRKTTIFSLILFLGVIGFIACGKKSEAPKAGSASADDMLGLLPMNAKGVILVNVNQAMAIEAADKAIKESDDYQKYLEFIEKTGIDPQRLHLAFASAAEGVKFAEVINDFAQKIDTLGRLALDDAQGNKLSKRLKRQV